MGAIHHHSAKQSEFRKRGAYYLQIFVKFSAIEWFRLEHTTAKRRTGKIWIIVGIINHGPKLHRGVAL